MTIVQGETTTFRSELLQGVHDFANDTFKMALYTSLAELGNATTAYSATNEVEGAGYTAGGAEVTINGPTVDSGDGRTVFIDFDDVVWEGSTITARAALLYNSSKSNKAVAVFDFGSDRSSDGGPFRVRAPEADAANAALRLQDPA